MMMSTMEHTKLSLIQPVAIRRGLNGEPRVIACRMRAGEV
jgi:hypothetical protein